MNLPSLLLSALVLAFSAADAAPAATGFAWELTVDRLSLCHAGRPVADYVFNDPQTLRPHFQNLRAPSGVQTALTEKNGGLVVNSDGLRGAKVAWGKRAAWAAYSREIDGRLRGAAIFPASANPTPTWWHTRDYGVFVANGFGKLVLPSEAAGKLVLKPGAALNLRYGVLLFDAPAASPVDFAAVNRQLQSQP